jgi:hypothetical protein
LTATDRQVNEDGGGTGRKGALPAGLNIESDDGHEMARSFEGLEGRRSDSINSQKPQYRIVNPASSVSLKVVYY